MITIGFEKKTVLPETDKELVKIIPLLHNAFKRKLEKLLDISIQNKAVVFGMIVVGKHRSDQIGIPAEFVSSASVTHVQITENKHA